MMLRRTRAAVSIVALSLVSSLLSAPAAAQPAAVPIQGYLTNGTRTFGLSSLGCDDRDAWVWDVPSSSWQCEPAAGGGSTYAAGAGLALDTDTGAFSLQAPTCGEG